MTFKTFLELVEIKTKIASIFPYIIGLLFSLSYFKTFNAGLSLLFLLAMLIFDMTVTAINNYQDFQKAKDEIYQILEYTKLLQADVLFLEPRKIKGIQQFILDRDYILMPYNN